MSGFLDALVLRARGEATVVRPLARSLYGEPGEPPGAVWEEVEAAQPAPPPAPPPAGETSTAPRPPSTTTPPSPPPLARPPGEHRSAVVSTLPAPSPEPADPAAHRIVELAREVEATPATPATPTTPPVPGPPRLTARPATSERPAERVVEPVVERPPATTAQAPAPGNDPAGQVPAAPRPATRPPGPVPAPARRRRATAPAEPLGRLPAVADPTGEAAGQVVRVSIGKVEVRAPAPPATPPPPAPPPPLARPSLSLDDYLRQRDEGSRR